MSDKIKSQHVGRKALLYVRQSSVYQVNHNLESQKLQYAMQQRLQLLGWHEIEVIDEDLGCSAAGTVTRSGFERMVAQVCMGKVGAVAAREVSRFARNSREPNDPARELIHHNENPMSSKCRRFTPKTIQAPQTVLCVA